MELCLAAQYNWKEKHGLSTSSSCKDTKLAQSSTRIKNFSTKDTLHKDWLPNESV
jgi:hypothetical protein